MSHSHPDKRAYRNAGVAAVLPFVLLAILPGSAARAESAGGGWVLDPGFEVRMVTYFLHTAGRSTTYPALGAHLGLELSSASRPVAAGLFADYELSSRDEQSGVRLAGGWARYRIGRWELATSGVHFESRHAGSQWLYASKLKLKPRPGHSLAVEAIGAIRGGGDPALQLVYETDLSEQVSLAIGVGLGANPMQDFGASTKFVWSLE